jgi:hypothetical protein
MQKIKWWEFLFEIIACVPIYIIGVLFVGYLGSEYYWAWSGQPLTTYKTWDIFIAVTLAITVALGSVARIYCKQRTDWKIFLILLILTMWASIFTYVLVTKAFQGMAA